MRSFVNYGVRVSEEGSEGGGGGGDVWWQRGKGWKTGLEERGSLVLCQGSVAAAANRIEGRVSCVQGLHLTAAERDGPAYRGRTLACLACSSNHG